MILTELPTEILDAVAEYVPAKALWRLARTCSILHEVALKQLWYQVHIDFHRAPWLKPSHMDHLRIHEQSHRITAFETDCFCRRSNVVINMDIIEPLLRHHSRRPLPFGYVRRLVISLEGSDLNFVNAFTSYKPRRCKKPCEKMVHYYSQLFEIISNLDLASILVRQLCSRTPMADTFKLVDYLATLSPAPILLSIRDGRNQSIIFPTHFNMSHLRVAHLDFTVYPHGREEDRRLSQSLFAEFLHSMAIPNLEKVSLYCRVPIAAATEEFRPFFAHCKTLKVLRLHGVYPVGTTQNWIPNSVTVLHLLASPDYGIKRWSNLGQHFKDLVTALPNVTELLFSSSDKRPLPIRPHQLSLPNLRRLIVKGKTPYLEFIFQQYSQSVQEFRAYNILYNELAPLIHKILPLQTLIVLYNKSIIGGQSIENWLELISQLHNIDIAILTPVYLSESDCSLACRTLRENKVDYILLVPDGATKPMRPRTLTRLGFYMGCDICAEDDSPLSKRSRIIAQSFNH